MFRRDNGKRGISTRKFTLNDKISKKSLYFGIMNYQKSVSVMNLSRWVKDKKSILAA
jgi:hypothetical protein